MTTSTETFEEKRAKEQAELERRKDWIRKFAYHLTRTGGAYAGFGTIIGDQRDANIRLVDGNGRDIHLIILQYGNPTGRLSVSGAYPRDGRQQYLVDHHRDTQPNITLASDRPIETLEKDIVRRFKDDYEALFKIVAERARQNDDRYDRLKAAKKRLVDLLEAKSNTFEDLTSGVEVSVYTPRWVKVRTHDADKYKLEVDDLSFEQLKEIVAVVRRKKSA